MMKSLGILKNKNGSGMVTAAFLVLIITIIASAFFEYARLKIIASGVRDAFQTAIVNVATENYDDLDYTIIDSYVGGYLPQSDDEWIEEIDEGDVYDHLDQLIGLSNDEYQISNLDIEIDNTSLAPEEFGDREGIYSITGTIHLKVPLKFGWDKLPPMEIDLKVKSGWRSKF